MRLLLGLLSKILRKIKRHGNEASRSSLEGCACKMCGKNIPSVNEDMFDSGWIYCADCTITYEPIEQFYWKSKQFKVLVYSFPSETLRAYADYLVGWHPTYQADMLRRKNLDSKNRKSNHTYECHVRQNYCFSMPTR